MASSDPASTSSQSLLPCEPLPWRPSTRAKLPPGALLDIDQGPLYDIITEWLPITDICRLDSALCQKRRRPEFLQLVSTKVLLFNREVVEVLVDILLIPETHGALGAAALKWVLNRGIHLATLHLPSSASLSLADQESIRDTVASLAYTSRRDKGMA